MSPPDPAREGGPAELLSSAGLEHWSRSVAAAGIVHDGPRATIEIRVSGGPDGPLAWHAILEPDAAPRYVAGSLPDADASYDETWDEAVGQFEGTFEPVVAYMQGTLKVKGATRPLYELFRLWAVPSHRSATASLRAG